MRFFANEIRTEREDQPDDDPAQAERQPGRVQSEPVAVPQQRPQSAPWANGPQPPFHPPVPQSTVFGAATVGGAVAVSAAAGPQTDATATDQRNGAGSTVTNDRAAAGSTVANDRAAAGPTVTNDRAEGSRGSRPENDVTLVDGGSPADPVVRQDRGGVDPVPVDERDGDTPVRDAHPAGDATPTDERTTGTAAVPATPAHPPASASPASAADTTTAAPTTTAPTAAPTTAAPAAAAPTGRRPGDATPPEVGPIVPDADAHAFRDRWREIQLCFVDDPKEAAAEAAVLVDRAVDALAASLRRQSAQLTEGPDGSSTDTEVLRVRLHGYRDFLDRLLGL